MGAETSGACGGHITDLGCAWVTLFRGDEVDTGPGAAGPTLQVTRMRAPRGSWPERGADPG